MPNYKELSKEDIKNISQTFEDINKREIFRDVINKIPKNKLKGYLNRYQAFEDIWKKANKYAIKYFSHNKLEHTYESEEMVGNLIREYAYYKSSMLGNMLKNEDMSKKDLEKKVFFGRTSAFRRVYGKEKTRVWIKTKKSDVYEQKEITINTLFNYYKEGLITKDRLIRDIKEFQESNNNYLANSETYKGRNYESKDEFKSYFD